MPLKPASRNSPTLRCDYHDRFVAHDPCVMSRRHQRYLPWTRLVLAPIVHTDSETAGDMVLRGRFLQRAERSEVVAGERAEQRVVGEAREARAEGLANRDEHLHALRRSCPRRQFLVQLRVCLPPRRSSYKICNYTLVEIGYSFGATARKAIDKLVKGDEPLCENHDLFPPLAN